MHLTTNDPSNGYATEAYEEACRESFDDVEYDVQQEARVYLTGQNIPLYNTDMFPKRLGDWLSEEEFNRIIAHVAIGDWIEAERELRKALIVPVVRKQVGA